MSDLDDAWYTEFRYAATQVGRATNIIEKLLATPDCPFIRQLANEFLHEHLPAAQR